MHSFFGKLLAFALRDPDRVALSDGHCTVTYNTLLAAMARLSQCLPKRIRTVGIAGRSGIAWIVSDLACTFAGARVVPIPSFFSREQVEHLCKDAAIDVAVLCDVATPRANVPTEMPVLEVSAADPFLIDPLDRDTTLLTGAYPGGSERIIYTSGTTGRPKGVIHGDRQLEAALCGIAATVAVTSEDRHVASLPYSLLLEQVAGIFVPLMCGASVHIDSAVIESSLQGNVAPLVKALAYARATTTILVPQQLRGLLEVARETAWRPPPSLRFVAVGGAHAGEPLLSEARRIGLPVRYGYGLSECCSVVAVQTPDDPEADAGATTVGRPLPHVQVSIEDGEIVVRGPAVMNGYINRRPLADAEWRTGDAGYLDAGGRLVVEGRRDRLLVLASGRNVSPEWVEATFLADPRFATAMAALDDDGHLCLELRPSNASMTWCLAATDSELRCDMTRLMESLPDYARPLTIRILGNLPLSDGTVRTLEIDYAQPETHPGEKVDRAHDIP